MVLKTSNTKLERINLLAQKDRKRKPNQAQGKQKKN